MTLNTKRLVVLGTCILWSRETELGFTRYLRITCMHLLAAVWLRWGGVGRPKGPCEPFLITVV